MFMLHQSKDIFRLWLLRRKVWHLRAESNNLAFWVYCFLADPESDEEIDKNFMYPEQRYIQLRKKLYF